jgi:hypothetical protein
MCIAQLAGLHTAPDHPLMQKIEGPCSRECGETIEGPRLFVMTRRIACDACIAKAKEADAASRHRDLWHRICPKQFRDHKQDHPKFPRAQHAATLAYKGKESLFLLGPTGTGKTSLAMMLAKRCLHHFDLGVGVMWPWDLEEVKRNGFKVREGIETWGAFDLLVMDDPLLTGAQDDRTTSFLKNLIDYRMQRERHNIITGQFGGEVYKQAANKWENASKADLERIDALLRRLREVCRVVSFADATPTRNEEAF